MKKIYIFLLSTLSGWNLLAQPAVDTSYQPVLGNFFSGKSFELTSGLTIATGPNVTWNLSSLSSHYTDTVRVKVINPTASLGGSFFPGANRTIVHSTSIDTLEYFFNKTTDDFQQLGFRPTAGDAREVFSNPRIQLQNMVYQDAFIDQSESIRYFFGTQRYARYVDTIYYSGFGTLTTPEGTYTNVPLIQRNTGISIADQIGGTYELLELYKEWEWYLPGYGFPYLRYGEEIYDYSFPEFAVINYKGYVGFVEPLTTRSTMNSVRTLTVKPNPSMRFSTIELSEIAPGQACELKWFDMQGRNVAKVQNRGHRVVLPEMEPGIYTLLTQTDGGIYRSRVIIE